MQTTPQLEMAYNYVQFTGHNVFLTGKAGTGKTTFLHHLRENALKRMVVCAPTGVAAINARGVTLHSFFQLPLGTLIGFDRMPPEKLKMNREKLNIIRSLNLLVIDEISMVRADMLDAVDFVLRRFRRRNKPFGGVQLLMIGDLQQLSPVVTDDEREQLYGAYDTPYFFSSKALRATNFVCIELTHVFRQHDEHFINLLNHVRENRMDTKTLSELNARYIAGFNPPDDAGYIILCTHNYQARRINEQKLAALATDERHFKATISGNFPEYAYPTEFELVLKENAQVMFVKNDPSQEKRYYNGRIGRITRISDFGISVLCPGDEEEILVMPADWDNVKFGMNEAGEIGEIVEGTFTQYPLRLAWAITIHKSQGLTFERAIIDAQSSFAHGQVYVALSRCKTLEGMVLSSPIRSQSVINDSTVSGFTQEMEDNQPDEKQYRTATQAYQREQLDELFNFKPLQHDLEYIFRLCEEYKSSVPSGTYEAFYRMLTPLKADIIEVAERFQVQMQRLLSQQPDIEHNAILQERIGKAATYFSDRLKASVLDVLGKVNLEIDNKDAGKRLNDAVNRFEDNARITCAGLLVSREGFNLTRLLNAKALANVEKEKAKSKPKEARKFKASEDASITHPLLYERLREWRRDKAAELDQPIYFILPQKTMAAVTNLLPTTKKALKHVNGFGDKKVQDFGDDILAIINEYCEENGIDTGVLPINRGE